MAGKRMPAKVAGTGNACSPAAWPLPTLRRISYTLSRSWLFRLLARRWHWMSLSNSWGARDERDSQNRALRADRRWLRRSTGFRDIAHQRPRQYRGHPPEPAHRLRAGGRAQWYGRYAEQHPVHQAIAAGDA